MNILLLRWLVLAFVVGTLTVLSAGCILSDGGYGYDDGGRGVGADYYEPYGADYGGWGPGYHVAPFRGGGHRRTGGGGHALRMLIDPRLLPARCRLFRRTVAAVAAVVAAVAVGDVK